MHGYTLMRHNENQKTISLLGRVSKVGMIRLSQNSEPPNRWLENNDPILLVAIVGETHKWWLVDGWKQLKLIKPSKPFSS